ncbi:hypothetical protein F4781DRAFT_310926 [Annulohypoxylon bovei var. microspora]|nr:hypothetical protein F4781DRAFT_310926 [Annulohypoxylon bovei var. microspora]
MLTRYFPPEILRLIFGHTSNPDLTALCLVSRDIYGIANEMLYASIAMDLFQSAVSTPFWMNANGDPKFHSLCRTLSDRPEFALFIKKLHILFYLRKFDQDALPPLDVVSSQLRVLASIIRKCANLQNIYVTHEYALSDSAIRDLNDAILSLSLLRKVRVIVRDTRFQGMAGRTRHIAGQTDVGVSLLHSALKLPSITSLDLTLQEGPQSPLQMLSFPINSNIVRLSLSEACINPTHLAKIIAAVPRVEELSLCFFLCVELGSTSPGSCLDSEDLGNALAVSRSTLVSLKIQIDFDVDIAHVLITGAGEGAGYALSRRLGSLRSYTRLKSLQLPPEVLLGWDEGDAPGLSELLPDSLESLHFRYDLSHKTSSPWFDFGPLCKRLGNYLGDSQAIMLKELVLSRFIGEDRDGIVDFIESQCYNRNVRFYVSEGRSGSYFFNMG